MIKALSFFLSFWLLFLSSYMKQFNGIRAEKSVGVDAIKWRVISDSVVHRPGWWQRRGRKALEETVTDLYDLRWKHAQGLSFNDDGRWGESHFWRCVQGPKKAKAIKRHKKLRVTGSAGVLSLVRCTAPDFFFLFPFLPLRFALCSHFNGGAKLPRLLYVERSVFEQQPNRAVLHFQTHQFLLVFLCFFV